MSYILEALKKAQAERQIGETPSIHAPTMTPTPAVDSTGSRKPMMVAVGLLGGAVVVLGAMLLMRQQGSAPAASDTPSVATPAITASPNATSAITASPNATPAITASPNATLATAPVAQSAPASAQPSVPSPIGEQRPAAQAAATRIGEQRPAAQAAAPVAPAPDLRADMAAATPAPATRASSAVAPAAAARASQPVLEGRKNAGADATHEKVTEAAQAAQKPQGGSAAAPTQTAQAAPAPAAVPAPAEEPVQTLRDLPEPIQRAIPQITMGGYMYSKNPADRLILIDKTLRKEGDEVAPGLLLERLLPRAAVFSFRGYRYKVPL
ncbi:general secretion pathway protein GspB [Pseudoduganella sp. RAF53_2]|uniref:general secretion pathway protein GspB n=1 Tax=unclassified Pseudoduganella TaxID=2637179 RepID=UPI003F962FDE